MKKEIIQNLPNKQYHESEGISSSVLKTALRSKAHLKLLKEEGFKRNKSMVLGDAIHMYILEPNRFAENYTEEKEVYKRNINGHVAGEPKLDENGEEIVMLKHLTDSSLDIAGEEYVKFKSMIKAYNECEEAKELRANAEHVETSFFFDKFKVRPDFITRDGWIVDLKTVGGMKDNPSEVNNFNRDFWEFGYDLQMFMYESIVKQFMDVKGFIFICLDAKKPSGVKIYKFINGESKWFEIGGYRFHEALEIMKQCEETNDYRKYDKVIEDDMELSYEASDYLAKKEINK